MRALYQDPSHYTWTSFGKGITPNLPFTSTIHSLTLLSSGSRLLAATGREPKQEQFFLSEHNLPIDTEGQTLDVGMWNKFEGCAIALAGAAASSTSDADGITIAIYISVPDRTAWVIFRLKDGAQLCGSRPKIIRVS